MDELIPIAEVNFMDLPPDVIQLAHLYIEVVEQQERGDYTHGYTPVEVEWIRTRIHNKFIDALRRARVNTSVRADTTELARRIVRWLPD